MGQIANAVGFIMRRELALGFVGWVAGWESELARQRSAAAMTRVLQRMLGQQLSRGWTTCGCRCATRRRVLAWRCGPWRFG